MPKKGFTLIELLVVISIIAILATLVILGVSSARKSAQDSRVISGLNQIRTLANIKMNYNDIEGDPGYQRIKEDIDDISEGGLVFNVSSGGNRYCAYARLPADPEQVFCVDYKQTAEKTDWSGIGDEQRCHETENKRCFPEE